MNDIRTKSILYSIISCVLLTFLVVSLNGFKDNLADILIISSLNLFTSLIIFWNNRPLLYYFWKSTPDWHKTSDIWLSALLGLILYWSTRYVSYTLHFESTFSYLGAILCLLSAFSYRRIYLRNAPEDVEKYDREYKYEEDMNTFVTVAECKDVESAHIIKKILESNGIEVITFGESAPKYIGSVPVRVLVRRKDQEEAERLINE